MRPVRWLRDAREEALEVAMQYGELDPELGEDVWHRIESKLDLAKRFPHIGQLVAEVDEVELRQHFLERFRYTLVLAISEQELVVIAFHHQRRDPDYWRPRLAKVQR